MTCAVIELSASEVAQGGKGLICERGQVAPTCGPPLHSNRDRSSTAGRGHLDGQGVVTNAASTDQSLAQVRDRFPLLPRAVAAQRRHREDQRGPLPDGLDISAVQFQRRRRRNPRRNATSAGSPDGRATMAAAINGSYPSCRTMSSSVGK